MTSIDEAFKTVVPEEMRPPIRQVGFALRQAMAGKRMLPDFIIIGAAKCGTTSLYNYLIQHPNVLPALQKEVSFFNDNYEKGVSWYKANFPLASKSEKVSQERGSRAITGESTPNYMFHPHCPRRTHALLPEAKLIIMLRNPVDRALSHYHHIVRGGHEKLTFEEGLQIEEERLEGEKEKMLADENYNSRIRGLYAYKGRGIYVDQLKAWSKYFPQNRFHIIESEGFYKDIIGAFDETVTFLGLPPWELKEPKKYNAGKYSRMRPETREYLIEFFRPHNRRLYDYLGRSFDWDR